MYCGLTPTKIHDVKRAIDNFTNYLRLRPYDEEVITNLALCYVYVEKPDYSCALKLLENALSFNPMYCRAHYNKALVLWRDKKYEESKKVIYDLIENDPNCPEANFAMCLIQYQIEKGSKDTKLKNTIYYLETAIKKDFSDIAWIESTSFLDDNFKKTQHYKDAILKIAKKRRLPEKLYKHLLNH